MSVIVSFSSNKIRINKEYGIEIELTEDKIEYAQITQLADDTSIFAKNEFVLWDHGFHCGTLKLLEGH